MGKLQVWQVNGSGLGTCSEATVGLKDLGNSEWEAV